MVVKKSVGTDGFLPRSWSELIPNNLAAKPRHAVIDYLPSWSMRMHTDLILCSTTHKPSSSAMGQCPSTDCKVEEASLDIRHSLKSIFQIWTGPTAMLSSHIIVPADDLLLMAALPTLDRLPKPLEVVAQGCRRSETRG